MISARFGSLSGDFRAEIAGRSRPDRCPGVLRPWPADDGLLVRLRLVGGRLPGASLSRLLQVSAEFADGSVYLTGRANLQLRGLPGRDGRLDPAVVAAIESTGLLPSRSHELVRNILVSPQTGYAGGRADLRPVAAQLDALLCGDAGLAGLPGRFLFVLDDGRGDLIDRRSDAGLVALGDARVQLRIGDGWGAVIGLGDAAARLAELAGAFQAARGDGPQAPWHVRELPGPLAPTVPTDPRVPAPSGPLPCGSVPGGTHVCVPDGVLTPDHGRSLVEHTELVVTPWQGVFIPQAQEADR
ncbi:nitrite reductase [Mycolicibacter sp. MYC123]|uniref:Nitrite reductase n=1 Tax=[Mycobacterium] zoologicum TaxID=2872311 RepID=A0ABU5YTI1_9MYCO|nr:MULTISPECIES: nitrite reductase [unclassified Mycolicibacter]MEB3052028.1 nitrite reductase [Mycolicibacter sp. MYC123]MEB3063988.1 nitrite reductase [Mycolicibacter sp. MYC101]